MKVIVCISNGIETLAHLFVKQIRYGSQAGESLGDVVVHVDGERREVAHPARVHAVVELLQDDVRRLLRARQRRLHVPHAAR